MENIYKQLEQLLAKVDFAAIWPGFAPCEFAVFNQQTVLMKDGQIPWDERFMASTIITFEGRRLAIWYVETFDNLDLERTAAGLVHEMFHALQNDQGDRRGPDEFELLTYPADVNNYELKFVENQQLQSAYAAKSWFMLEHFSIMRHARHRLIGDVIKNEWLCETGEGLAEFAGLMALKQLSAAKYAEDVLEHINRLHDPKMLFGLRRISYSVGCVLALTMHEMGIDFTHHLSDTRTLFEFLPRDPDGVKTHFDSNRQALKDKFDKTRNSGAKVARNAKMTGFDPMNMWRIGDEILCERFVMLDGEYMQGPVLLEMQAGTMRDVVAFTQKEAT